MESPFVSAANHSSVENTNGVSPYLIDPSHVSPIALLAIASGIMMHTMVFRIGEWDTASPSIVVAYASVISAATFLSTSQFSIPFMEIAQAVAYHVGGLFVSMLIYRHFFHRLSKYPGPFLARLTTFYITARSMKKLHLFEEVRSLHAQYGDIVRLGMSARCFAQRA